MRALLFAILALAPGCSIIYGDESIYNPECKTADDCSAIDPLFVCGPGGRCITCDEDGDGWPGGMPVCSDLVNEEFDTEVDCNDRDATISPGLPPICGDAIDQSCETAQFRALEMLLGGGGEEVDLEAGPIPPRILWERGDRVFSFGIGTYPLTETTRREDPDLVAIIGYGEAGAGEARIFELDADTNTRSREINPAAVRTMDTDWAAITDVREVTMAGVLVIPPSMPGMDPDIMFGVGAGVTGRDSAGRFRVSGGSVDHDMDTDLLQYTPFVSIPRPGEVSSAAIVEVLIPTGKESYAIAPGAAWREPGGTAVRHAVPIVAMFDAQETVSSPEIPAEPRDVGQLHGSFSTFLIGDSRDGNGIFWWDMLDPAFPGERTGSADLAMPHTGRIAVGYLGEVPGVSGSSQFVIAYPNGNQIVYQFLGCATPSADSCALDPTPIARDLGAPTDQYDMDFFAVGMIEHPEPDREVVAIRILNPMSEGGGLDFKIPVLESSDVNGKIEDLKLSLSFEGETGLNVVVAVLVRPYDDPNAFEIWAAGARICGSEPMMPMPDGGVPDGGAPDAGPPVDTGPRPDAGRTCPAYCSNVLTTCTDIGEAQFQDMDDCLGTCDTWAATGDMGNNLECRLGQLASMGGGGGSCGAAGPAGQDPDGAGSCTNQCYAFCSLAQAVCPDMLYMTMIQPFCEDECATVSDPAGYMLPVTMGANLDCRLHQATIAAGATGPDIMTHCLNAAGAGPCM